MSRTEKCHKDGSCDFTHAYYPYGIAIMLTILDADAIFNLKGPADPKDNPLTSTANFCESVREYRRANSKKATEGDGGGSAYSAIPVHYGASLVSYQKLVFENYECELTGDEMKRFRKEDPSFLFESPLPTSKESVNYVMGFQPSSIDDRGVPPPPIDDAYLFAKGVPDFDLLLRCMRGKATGTTRCGNELSAVSSQLSAHCGRAARHPSRALCKGSPEGSVDQNNTQWDDPMARSALYA